MLIKIYIKLLNVCSELSEKYLKMEYIVICTETAGYVLIYV